MLKFIIPSLLLGSLITWVIMDKPAPVQRAAESKEENLSVLQEKISKLEKKIPEKINQENFEKVQEIYGEVFQMLLVDLGLHMEMKKWSSLQEKLPSSPTPPAPTCEPCPTPTPTSNATPVPLEKINEPVISSVVGSFKDEQEWVNANTSSKTFQQRLKDSIGKAVPITKKNEFLELFNGTFQGKARLNGGRSSQIELEFNTDLAFDKKVGTYWGKFISFWIWNKLPVQRREYTGKSFYLKMDSKRKNHFYYQWDDETVLVLIYHKRRNYWYGHLFSKSPDGQTWRNRARFKKFAKVE